MKIQIVGVSNGKQIAVLENLDKSSTVKDVKDKLHLKCPKYYPSRQSLRLETTTIDMQRPISTVWLKNDQTKSGLSDGGKSIKDELKLADLDLPEESKLYFKDLGPQIGWSTVFLTEYSGPLLAYLMFVARPAFIYGAQAGLKPRASVVWIAAGCWSFHYVKRLLETLFVHRFSKGTMPIKNLFKNCSYYWGFAAFVSYYVNHPLYTPPAFGDLQIYIGLAGFLLGEYGNFVSHCVLRDLRPKGSTVRRIPYPTSNPMSFMFNLVSCPNYTYEVLAWMFFTVMTQTFPAGLFTLAGLLQMAEWAHGKHRNYRKEFQDYPKSRKCIIPFLF